jgi:restriction endonuclease Mrr
MFEVLTSRGQPIASQRGQIPDPLTPARCVDVTLFSDEAAPATVKIVRQMPSNLVERLLRNPNDLSLLSGKQFEELIRERLEAAGYLVLQSGQTNTPDGGVDFFVRTKLGQPLIPVIGAIQVKHHSRPDIHCEAKVVREMAGFLEAHRYAINFGLAVTNTAFSLEAKWFVRKKTQMFLRVREGEHVRNWIESNFADLSELSDLPESIDLTSKLKLKLDFDE